MLEKWLSTGPSTRRERSLASAVSGSGGKGSCGTAGEGAEQGPEEGRILPEESVGDKEAEKEAVKQVRIAFHSFYDRVD